MATTTPFLVQTSHGETIPDAPIRTNIKELVESCDLTSIPSKYTYSKHPNDFDGSEPENTIPIIDFSLLTSGDPHQRSKVIQDLDKACREWGFFVLVNHGVPESLTNAVFDGCIEFFNLPMEEKLEFTGKDLWEPIRFSTGVDVKVEKFFCWRDFLKVFVHPQFHFPNKPQGFSDISQEFCRRTREVGMELLKGIWESLGLEQGYIEKALNLGSGFQLFTVNLYPPCPQSELAIGIPAHTDYGLLTLLTDNEVGGLQIQHNGKWLNVNRLSNSFLVNTADHLEILSNGKYKSVMHRALVNDKVTRISIALPNGPSLDTVISPIPELVERENRQPAYLPMKYKDYMDLKYAGKSGLNNVQIQI